LKKKKIKSILIINTGGGIGDAIQYLKLFKILNQEFQNIKIDYYATDLNNFWFNNVLKSLKPNNVNVIKDYPMHFGSKIINFFISKQKFQKKYDLIIDNQTKIRDTLIYKKIPHKIFLSMSARGLLSNPIIFQKKQKHVQKRFVECLENFLQKKINLETTKINVKDKYQKEANRLISNKKKYVGFSIKAGHPSRLKEFDINEIIKTAIYFANRNYIPTFFLEEKYKKIISQINKTIPQAYFPEHKAKPILKNPSLVIALGKKMNFNITINNGVMHMLGLSKKKLFCFFEGDSDKFKPLSKNIFVYDCKKQDKKINLLKSEEIIEFINNFV
jgi:ADP-heptose:LPS heptosyltransferase